MFPPHPGPATLVPGMGQLSDGLAVVVDTPNGSAEAETQDRPACISCRKRKLRCSREQPSCSQCLRLESDCVYDQRRQKPGLKTGAIEAINRRLDLVEQRLDHQNRDTRLRQTDPSGGDDVRDRVSSALLSLANQLGRDSGESASFIAPTSLVTNRPEADVVNDATFNVGGAYRQSSAAEDGLQRGVKRRRLDLVESRSPSLWDDLPSQDVIDALLAKYFSTVHHWIPIIHERRFRARLKEDHQSPGLAIILHAIVATTMKHVDHGALSLDSQRVIEQIKRSTVLVTLEAMDSLSIENCQALIMLCFEQMGSGNWQKAFSLLASLVRTVDYLGLTTEPAEHRPKPLLPPIPVLAEPISNAEAEERKRVFWNAFLLDRIVSVSSGFSTGFTSDMVSRRLPCNGGIWRRNEESRTPYFGIWEKSQARIGQPITSLPVHRALPNDHGQPVRSPGSGGVDISQLGALAYRIEATENMTQISTFFLQQNVDFKDSSHISDWLTRFKELDLRLVQWKRFLPDRWKESNVSKEPIVWMDPNLTLSHVMHNTSMILLHQPIAYPTPGLKAAVKLPNFCSADTCEQAAIETSAITSKYLRFTEDIMVNTEFVYCVCIAAKVLLAHSYYYNSTLSGEFFVLVRNLEEMSRRWRALAAPTNMDMIESGPAESYDLAGQYASRLRGYHSRCQKDPEFAEEILLYSGADVLMLGIAGGAAIHTSNGPLSNPSHTGPVRRHSRVSRSEREETVTPIHFPRQNSHEGVTATSSPSVPQRAHSSNAQGAVMSGNINSFRPADYSTPSGQDNLLLMSNMLLDQNFADLDRVITHNGADFSFYGMNDFYGYNNA